jgi:hypothetical protein
MSITSWIILIFVFSGASFFAAAALCSSQRDIELSKAYKRGVKDSLRRENT